MTTCLMCGEQVEHYVSRRGKRFCGTECSGDWANMNPMPVRNSSQGRKPERGPRKVRQ